MTGHLTGLRLRESFTESYIEDRSATVYDLDLIDDTDDADDALIVWSKSNEEGISDDENQQANP